MTPKQSNALVTESNAMAYERRQSACNDVLKNFSNLPDEAHVRLPVVMRLCGCSAATIWRYSKNGTLPGPRKFGARVTAWNVGQLRAALRSFSSNSTGGSHE